MPGTKTGAELLAELAGLTLPCPNTDDDCKGDASIGLLECSICNGSGATPRFPTLRERCVGVAAELYGGSSVACQGCSFCEGQGWYPIFYGPAALLPLLEAAQKALGCWVYLEYSPRETLHQEPLPMAWTCQLERLAPTGGHEIDVGGEGDTPLEAVLKALAAAARTLAQGVVS